MRNRTKPEQKYLKKGDISYAYLEKLSGKNAQAVTSDTQCTFNGQSRPKPKSGLLDSKLGLLNNFSLVSEIGSFFADEKAAAIIADHYKTRPFNAMDDLFQGIFAESMQKKKKKDAFFQDEKTGKIFYKVKMSSGSADACITFTATFQLTANGYEFVYLKYSPSSLKPKIEKLLSPNGDEILQKIEALSLQKIQPIHALQKNIVELVKETIKNHPKDKQSVFSAKFLALLPFDIQSIIHDISLLNAQCKQQVITNRKEKKCQELKSKKVGKKQTRQALLALEQDIIGVEELNESVSDRLPSSEKDLSVERSAHLFVLHECLDRLRLQLAGQDDLTLEEKNLINTVLLELILPLHLVATAIALKRKQEKTKNAAGQNKIEEIVINDGEIEHARYVNLMHIVDGVDPFADIQREINLYLTTLKTTWPLNDNNEVDVETWSKETLIITEEMTEKDHISMIMVDFIHKLAEFENDKKEISKYQGWVSSDHYAVLSKAIEEVSEQIKIRTNAFELYLNAIIKKELDDEKRRSKQTSSLIATIEIRSLCKESNKYLDDLNDMFKLDLNHKVDVKEWLAFKIEMENQKTALAHVTEAIDALNQKYSSFKEHEKKLASTSLKDKIDPERYADAKSTVDAVIIKINSIRQALENDRDQMLVTESAINEIQHKWSSKDVQTVNIENNSIEKINARLAELRDDQHGLTMDRKKINQLIPDLNDSILSTAVKKVLSDAEQTIAAEMAKTEKMLACKKQEVEAHEKAVQAEKQAVAKIVSKWLKIGSEIDVSTILPPSMTWEKVLHLLEEKNTLDEDFKRDKKYIMDSRIEEKDQLSTIFHLDEVYSEKIFSKVLAVQTEAAKRINLLIADLTEVKEAIDSLDSQILTLTQQIVHFDAFDVMKNDMDTFLDVQNTVVKEINVLNTEREQLRKSIYSKQRELSTVLDKLSHIEHAEQELISTQKNGAGTILDHLSSLDTKFSAMIDAAAAILDGNASLTPKIEKMQAVYREAQQKISHANENFNSIITKFKAGLNLVQSNMEQGIHHKGYHDSHLVFSYKDKLIYLKKCQQAIETACLEADENIRSLRKEKESLEEIGSLRYQINITNLCENADHRVDLKSSKLTIEEMDQRVLSLKNQVQTQIDQITAFKNNALKQLKYIHTQVQKERKNIEHLNDIKDKLINSKPFKKLVERMPRSTKWAQINTYLKDIKLAGTIDELLTAVKADPKDVKVVAKSREVIEGDSFYLYKKSMRENTMHHLYGFFHQGSSKTDDYARQLESKLHQILAGVYPNQADKRNVFGKKP